MLILEILTVFSDSFQNCIATLQYESQRGGRQRNNLSNLSDSVSKNNKNNNHKKEMKMKRFLKASIAALFCLFVVSVNAVAANDKPIEVSKLPQTAQQILKKDFSKMKIALAKMESGIFDTSYDIIFTNGDKVEFDRSGNWTELKCKYSQVPARLIPSAISNYAKKNYPGTKILEIERDRSEYDVKLSNGIEITFNKKFQVIDIDN
jgi:hypothetical protein